MKKQDLIKIIREQISLQNFSKSIKPVMLKIKNKQKLTSEELESILQFYLEAVQELYTTGKMNNFIANIKPTMLKIKNKQKLSNSELESFLQFYIEVISTLSE